MFKKFCPTWYSSSIHLIDLDFLLSNGIKYIICDLDNTIIPYDVKIAGEKEQKWLEKLKKNNFNILISSNNSIKRVDLFCVPLDLNYVANAKKPLVNKTAKYLKKNMVDLSKCVLIGDQIITDIWFANNLGIKSILVKPVQEKESKRTYLNRRMDRIIRKKLLNKDLLINIERSE